MTLNGKLEVPIDHVWSADVAEVVEEHRRELQDVPVAVDHGVVQLGS
jgi:hypothetical protein